MRYLTDSTGTVTDTYDYDAFGNLINSTGTTPNNYLFAGEQFDPDINLYYNRARYLDVRRGRFWGMDTEEGNDDNPLSLHKYLYAEGNPIDNVDHSGNDVGDTLNAMATIQNTILQKFQISINLATTINMRAASEWQLSDAGASFTTSWDTFHPKPYSDSDGQCTWGYGHVIDSSPCTADQLQLSISQPAAVQQFKADATKFESIVSSV